MFPFSFYASPVVRKIFRKLPFWTLTSSKEDLDKVILDFLDSKSKKEIFAISKRMDELHRSWNVHSILIWDERYPKNLKEIYDPPLVIFVIGNPELLQKDWVAVVGTRRASPLSLKATEYLVKNFIPKEYGVASGLALGIDRIAMIQSIEMGRPTLGVLGTSIEKEYPYANRSLYKKMKSSKNCILITEYLPDMKYLRWTFPMRNRIITGISEAVFLMEAPAKSGAISSAKSAIQQNREIYVFKHGFQYDNSGGESLLEEGANLLSWEEILPDTLVLHAVKDKVQLLKDLQIPLFCSGTAAISEWEYRGILMKLAEEGSLIPIGDELYCIFRK